jgi:hypothetical protein
MKPNETHELSEETSAVLKLIKQAIAHGAQGEKQEELAQWLGLMVRIEVVGNRTLLDMAEVAVRCIVAEPPLLTLAAQLRAEVSQQLDMTWLRRMRLFLFGYAPTVRVVLGLWVTFMLVGCGLFFMPDAVGEDAYFMAFPSELFKAVVIYGALGNVL